MVTKNSQVRWLETANATGVLVKTRTRNGELAVARLREDSSHELKLQARRDDAHVAIVHLSERPPSRSSFGGTERADRGGPRGSFSVANLGDAPHCRVWGKLDNLHLHIPRAALDDIAAEADSPPVEDILVPKGWDTSDPIVQAIAETLAAAMDRPDEISQLFADHMILGLQAHLARTYGGLREGQRLRTGGLAPWQARRAKELIAANLTKELSIVQIAAQCELSAAHFSRAFKTSTGMTPHSWLQTCRVERAKDLLLSPEASIASIAVACGFADQSHFSRIFMRIAGDTPAAWRRFRRAA